MNATMQNATYELFFQKAYAHQKKTGGGQIAVFDALKYLLENKIEARTAAARIASYVFSKNDFLPAYESVLGHYSCIIGAASAIQEEHHLCKLAELILSLSNLPDAHNDSQEPLRLQDYNNDHNLVIQPGEIITIDNGRIWADLPLFRINFCDSMYGPEAWINDGLEDHIAEQRWLNLNTFAAFMVRDCDDSEGSFDYMLQYAFRTLTYALEYDPRATETLLHLTSACRWVAIAGPQLSNKSSMGTQHAGPIWVAQGGSSLICPTRWMAWANRLDELANSDLIQEEVKNMASSSASKIRALYGNSVG